MSQFTPIALSAKIANPDARVKLLVLLVFSISVFICSRWAGMALFCAVVIPGIWRLKGYRKRFIAMMGPVVGLSAMVVLIRLVDIGGQITASDILDSAFIALRFILLAAASLLVALSTSSTELMNALRWMLTPLRHFGINTTTACTVLSMALSFIPRLADDFATVQTAQKARGASFSTGSLWQRLKSCSRLFIPVFISAFRHADAIGTAMDARCFGAPGIEPTSLHSAAWGWQESISLALGLMVCVVAVVI